LYDSRGTTVTLAVSATVFEILTLKARKSLNFPTPPFFEASLRENFGMKCGNLASEN